MQGKRNVSFDVMARSERASSPRNYVESVIFIATVSRHGGVTEKTD
jgi:hypothetical protein